MTDESRIRVTTEQIEQLNRLEEEIYNSPSEISHSAFLDILIESFKEQNNF